MKFIALLVAVAAGIKIKDISRPGDNCQVRSGITHNQAWMHAPPHCEGDNNRVCHNNAQGNLECPGSGDNTQPPPTGQNLPNSAGGYTTVARN